MSVGNIDDVATGWRYHVISLLLGSMFSVHDLVLFFRV